ncbi:DNA adenine methylase [Achromobacter sp. NFACC18-2]|uniref:DNA adenine methylase n=1 Tax=Achromobacter sp. NFACC18-2 TaxID=1564112 RepID=UPI0008CC3126|nr:DNA adenine methylase [Achromobacter sp. NFACC18-2]SEK11902.1 DNA adenine methylase [Achromobacter sp. NFACC18-2]
MSTTETPLRYPGGKSQLAPFVTDLLRANGLLTGVYAEPFAGGAGLAFRLLFAGHVSEIWLNDIDPAIYGFWHSVLHDTEALCDRIQKTPVTIEEWHRQHERLFAKEGTSLDLGYAAFFLNRTNRSGIITGGVIGGKKQAGDYKIDCRFNKEGLLSKIRRIASHKEVIKLTQLDAETCIPLWEKTLPKRALMNIDPPYYVQGKDLYTNFYKPEDHKQLAQAIRKLKCPWMLTYDDAAEVKALYRGLPLYKKGLNYFAQVKRQANELLVLSPKLVAPASLVGSVAAAA